MPQQGGNGNAGIPTRESVTQNTPIEQVTQTGSTPAAKKVNTTPAATFTPEILPEPLTARGIGPLTPRNNPTSLERDRAFLDDAMARSASQKTPPASNNNNSE